jgi:hypothetical protein
VEVILQLQSRRGGFCDVKLGLGDFESIATTVPDSLPSLEWRQVLAQSQLIMKEINGRDIVRPEGFRVIHANLRQYSGTIESWKMPFSKFTHSDKTRYIADLENVQSRKALGSLIGRSDSYNAVLPNYRTDLLGNGIIYRG